MRITDIGKRCSDARRRTPSVESGNRQFFFKLAKDLVLLILRDGKIFTPIPILIART